MWIIPSNHPLSSAFAQGYLASKEDLNELGVKCRVAAYVEIEAFIIANLVAGMEAGVLDPAPIWTDAKTFDARPFVERYTESLEVIHVPENRQPGYERAICIKDSFGRLLEERSRQADLFGAFLKTWTTTLRERIRLYNEAYEIWVMQLRQESLQRRKLAALRRERESSYSLWPTACATNYKGPCLHGTGGPNLQTAVHHWQTPIASRGDYQNTSSGKKLKLAGEVKKWTTPVASDLNRNTVYKQGGTALSLQVKNWATPKASDHKNSGTSPSRLVTRNPNKNGGGFSLELPAQVQLNGPLARESSNTTGKSQEQLNPAWDAQLMGTTLEKILFVPLATQWLSRPQK
jgi:hypothetical protein